MGRAFAHGGDHPISRHLNEFLSDDLVLGEGSDLHALACEFDAFFIGSHCRTVPALGQSAQIMNRVLSGSI
jgi:hypothetical protein